MFSALRSNWRILGQGSPGRRFQDLYRHRRAHGKQSGAASRALLLGLGALLVLASPLAGLVPGPGGILVFLFGAALLASELLVVARWLDWCEPRARKTWKRIRRA